MTNFNPLAKILEENRLAGPNYVDWKRNRIIVLIADKIAHVLNTESPELALIDATEAQRDAFNKWHEADEMAKCYNGLYDQCVAKTMPRPSYNTRYDVAPQRDVWRIKQKCMANCYEKSHVHQNGGRNSSSGTCPEDDFFHQQTRYASCKN